MQLYLVRHGDAIDRQSAGLSSDQERWLTDEGRQEARWSSALLHALGVEPGLVMSSPLLRARQTAEIIADVTGAANSIAISQHLEHGGSFSGILDDIRGHGNPQIVVLTGHMPSIGRLAGWLCWNDRQAAIGMRTAQVARIDLPSSRIAPGWGDLRWLLAPIQAQALGIDT